MLWSIRAACNTTLVLYTLALGDMLRLQTKDDICYFSARQAVPRRMRVAQTNLN